jgi:hypothetical protein
MSVKQSRNMGLSNVLDVSEGGRAPMMANAINLLMQARAMSRPTDEDLKRYGVDRYSFENLLSEIAKKNSKNEPSANLDVSSSKASPKLRALGFGLAGAIPAGLGSYLAGASPLSSIGVGLLTGGAGAAIGGMGAAEKNKKLLATANALRDHGILTRGALAKAMPILSDKTAAEKASGLFYRELSKPTPVVTVEESDNPEHSDESVGLAAMRTQEPRFLTRLFKGDSDYANAFKRIQSKNNLGQSRDATNHVSNDLGEILKEMYPSRYRNPTLDEVGNTLINLASNSLINQPKNEEEFQKLFNRYTPMTEQRYLSPENKEFIKNFIKSTVANYPYYKEKPQAKAAAAKPGLWANIHAKKQRGEAPAKPGDKDYPTAKNWKKVTSESEKTARTYGNIAENVFEYFKMLPHAAGVGAGLGGAKSVITKNPEKFVPQTLEGAARSSGIYTGGVLGAAAGAALSKFLNGGPMSDIEHADALASMLGAAGGGALGHIATDKLFSKKQKKKPEENDKVEQTDNDTGAEKKAAPAWQTSEGKSESGGLNDKGRASLKAQGHDIKRPQPEGGPRKDSFCARMKGMKAKLTSEETARDPDSRINKALRKWKCGSAAEKLASLLKEARCWKGYEPVPGKKPYSEDSCKPVGEKAKSKTPKAK